MRPVHTTKSGRRHRYYVSPALIDSSVVVGATGWRIPADEIEAALAKVILDHLKQQGAIGVLIDGKTDAQEVERTMERLKEIRDKPFGEPNVSAYFEVYLTDPESLLRYRVSPNTCFEINVCA